MKNTDKTNEMIEIYLGVVAAQLPKAEAEDITAELRDDILARIEGREEGLGRALTEAEVEALLREVGHPLVVAARYGSQPKSLIGPELYPWFMFAARLSLYALLLLAGVRIVSGLLFGQELVGTSISYAFSEFINGALTVAGLLAIAGWFIERQENKPKFLTHWRVRDLEMFSRTASVEKRWKDYFAGNVAKRNEDKAKPLASRSDFSPAAGAATSAVLTSVVLLWWLGLLGGMRVNVLTSDVGFELWSIMLQVREALFLPVAILLAARVAFDLIRFVTGIPVRFTALGELGFALANIAILTWLWTRSALAPRISVDSFDAFIERIAHSQSWTQDSLATVVMAVVVVGVICEFITAVQAVMSFVINRKVAK